MIFVVMVAFAVGHDPKSRLFCRPRRSGWPSGVFTNFPLVKPALINKLGSVRVVSDQCALPPACVIMLSNVSRAQHVTLLA